MLSNKFMWVSNLEFSEKGNPYRDTIVQNNEKLTFAEAVETWKDNMEFRQFYISLIANLPYEAIFWESPAINVDSKEHKDQGVSLQYRFQSLFII